MKISSMQSDMKVYLGSYADNQENVPPFHGRMDDHSNLTGRSIHRGLDDRDEGRLEDFELHVKCIGNKSFSEILMESSNAFHTKHNALLSPLV